LSSDIIQVLQEPINSVKSALILTGAGGGATGVTAAGNDGGFLSRVYSLGIDHIFAGWDSQDTLTILGFMITCYGLHLTRQGLRLRRQELRLKFKEFKDG
jgi:hypothetical protein